MAQRASDFDDDNDDDFNDPEDPEESDQDGDDDPDEVECPYCGAATFESAELCPKCGSFVSYEDAPRTSQPRWVIWVAIALIVFSTMGLYGLIHFL